MNIDATKHAKLNLINTSKIYLLQGDPNTKLKQTLTYNTNNYKVATGAQTKINYT